MKKNSSDTDTHNEQTRDNTPEEQMIDQKQEHTPVTDCEDSKGAELAACQAELASWKDKYLRQQAEFQNFTRRSQKERSQLAQMGQVAVLTDILAIIDDFDRALGDVQETSNSEHEDNSWRAGFALIHAAAYKLLEKYGVVPMSSEQYAHFDPTYHEAIMQVDSADHEQGMIVQVLQQGFMHNDLVLRPAKVSVAK